MHFLQFVVLRLICCAVFGCVFVGVYSMIASLNLYFKNGHAIQRGVEPQLGERGHRVHEGASEFDCPRVHCALRQDSQGSAVG